MDLQASLKRVPRWAWFTSAGVALGAIALYILRNRAGVEDSGAPTMDSAGNQPTGVPDTYGPSPVPGIVVPSINLPADTTGQNGYLDLHNLYMEGLRDVLDAMGAVQAPAAAAPILPNPLPVVITGGGVPATPRAGVVAVKPPAKPATAAKTCEQLYPWFPHHNTANGAPSPKSCYQNCGHCERDKRGKRYRDHGHCYKDGHRVHLNNEYPGGC